VNSPPFVDFSLFFPRCPFRAPLVDKTSGPLELAELEFSVTSLMSGATLPLELPLRNSHRPFRPFFCVFVLVLCFLPHFLRLVSPSFLLPLPSCRCSLFFAPEGSSKRFPSRPFVVFLMIEKTVLLAPRFGFKKMPAPF